MHPVRVLLVDDNEVVRESFRALLEKVPDVQLMGECRDGEEVIPFLIMHSVDVIFMDALMKHMDGFEATELVKQHFKQVKVIGLTAFGSATSLEKMRNSGVDGFVSKFDADQAMIHAEIARVLN
ncbi:MAG: response regulator transcription factor [Flavobacteriales bacterium]|nr:response regulator transcription factor [Flavobacteriales bacterium]